MKFVYKKEIDDKCKIELKACDSIFGEKKKTETYLVDDNVVKKFESIWTEEINTIFEKGIEDLFGDCFPEDFTCFINSTPYSMDFKEGISISASVATPVRTICHEANHYMFRKSAYKEKYFSSVDMEDAKEIFTIVNNLYFQDIMENQDIGWKKFWKERFKFLAVWLKEKDFDIIKDSH